MTYMSDINDILKTLNTISLERMDKVKLMNRLDTKYIINVKQLPNILNGLDQYYDILSINNESVFW